MKSTFVKIRLPILKKYPMLFGLFLCISGGFAARAFGAVGQINYYTGHVITNPQIVMVYVGGWDNSPKSINAQTVIERWITNIGGTKYFNMLSGYYQGSPANHVVNTPLSIAGRIFDPDTTNPMNATRVNAFLKPYTDAVSNSTIFVQVPSAGISPSCGGGAPGCRGAFAVGGPGTFIVTAFDSDGSFNPRWSSLWFHELAETITDSDGTGWSLADGNEVGDACDYPNSPWQIPSVRISLTPANDAFQIAGVPVLAINGGINGMKFCSHSYSTGAELFGIGTFPYHLYRQHINADSGLTHGNWNDWGTLGAIGYLSGGPGVASWGPGRVDVFNFDTASQLRHGYVDASNPACPGADNPCVDNWGTAAGYKFFGEPSVASRGPGQLDVFAMADCYSCSGPVLFQRSWYSGSDSGWVNRGAPAGVTIATGPAAAAYNPDQVSVFVTGSDNNIYRGVWTGTFTWSLWLGPQNLNGDPMIWQGKPAAATWAPGRFDVMLIDTKGRLFDCGGDANHTWGACSLWQPPTGITFTNSPAIVQMGDQRLVVTARGSDGQGWSKLWNYGADTGPWTASGGRLGGASVGLSSW